MVVLEITSEASKSNIPVNGYEFAILFMVGLLIAKFIVDYNIDMKQLRVQQFTTYQNQIKKGIDGNGTKNSYN